MKELAVVAGHLAMPDGYVAIGEIGMDLYWDKTYLKEQQIVFERQVRWALEYGLPVVIHCREAFDYIYDILKPYKTSSLRGFSIVLREHGKRHSVCWSFLISSLGLTVW